MVITNLGAKPLVLQIPIGAEDQFQVSSRAGEGGRAMEGQAEHSTVTMRAGGDASIIMSRRE